MPLVSASSLHRAIACPASAVLTQNEYGRPAAMRAAANRGTAIHKYLEELVLGVPKETALERVFPEYREQCEKIDTDKVIWPGAETEKALVYNVYTGKARCAGYGVAREYGELEDGEVPGTPDLTRYYEDTCGLYFRDYKTGKTRYAPAKDNCQLKFFALAGARLYGVNSAGADLCYIGEDGSVEIDFHYFCSSELDHFADQLEQMYKRIEEVKEHGPIWVDVKKGEHCRFCMAKRDCKEIR